MLPLSYACRNLLRDPAGLLQKVLGSALVVFLVLAAAAFNGGMNGLLRSSGDPQNLIFLGAGSEESLERSEVPREAESLIGREVPGIARGQGGAAVSGEIHYNGRLALPDGTSAQARTRGVTRKALEVHRAATIVEGDWPAEGEVLAGTLAHHVLGVPAEALAVGETVWLEDQPFRVSGRLAGDGTVLESELWFPREELAGLLRRDTLSGVVARLEDASPMNRARADLFTKQRLDLGLAVVPASAYYAGLARFYGPIRGMTWLTAVLVGFGAVLGGLNLLYATFASRVQELATLQTLGFRRGSLLVALVQESLLIQVLGLGLALAAAHFLFGELWIEFSTGTFRMKLTPEGVGLGLLTAFLLGTLGTLPPAWRCLRLPLPVALRAP